MKKFLVLLMIIGFVASANAALVWTDAAGDAIVGDLEVGLGSTVTVYLTSTQQGGYNLAWVGNDPGAAEVTDIVVAGDLLAQGLTNGYGDKGTIDNPTTTGYPGWWGVSASDTTTMPVAGIHYAVDITGMSVGEIGLDSDSYESWGDNDVLNVVVPEPITIALMGLGGLFLRRRK
jgi:hypothetical protein